MPDITRRRAFRIAAAAAGVPLLIAGVRAAAPNPRFFTWQGEVLGAELRTPLHVVVGEGSRQVGIVRIAQERKDSGGQSQGAHHAHALSMAEPDEGRRNLG